jgi:hypothetical protein
VELNKWASEDEPYGTFQNIEIYGRVWFLPTIWVNPLFIWEKTNQIF